VEKIEAARTAKGLIVLEDDSAEQIKHAIEQVSRIIEAEDNQISFEGHRIVEGAGFALTVNCYDIYECPQGYLLHVYMDRASNWAVAGKTLEDMLDSTPDPTLARRAYGELVKKGLASFHQH